MRYDDHRVVIVRKEVLQPANGLKVKVVGGLVHDQDVGRPEEGLGQQHPHLGLSVKVPHHGVMHVLRYAQGRQEVGCLALGGPASHFLELNTKLPGQDPVLFRKVRLCVDLIQSFLQFVQGLVAHHHGLQDRVGIEGEVIL